MWMHKSVLRSFSVCISGAWIIHWFYVCASFSLSHLQVGGVLLIDGLAFWSSTSLPWDYSVHCRRVITWCIPFVLVAQTTCLASLQVYRINKEAAQLAVEVCEEVTKTTGRWSCPSLVLLAFLLSPKSHLCCLWLVLCAWGHWALCTRRTTSEHLCRCTGDSTFFHLIPWYCSFSVTARGSHD